MPLTSFDHVANFVADVTPDQIGRCHKIFDLNQEGGKHFYAVASESEPGKEYHVRYEEERGFSCTCPSGEQGFANVRHWSAVCKHCRWAVAAALEERGALAELSAQQDAAEAEEEAAKVDGEPGTRAHYLEIDGKEASPRDYARVLGAQPTQQPSEAEIKRDQERYAPRAFQIIQQPEEA